MNSDIIFFFNYIIMLHYLQLHYFLITLCQLTSTLYNRVNQCAIQLLHNETIVIAATDFLLKETGDEKARTKNAPEPHIPVELNALYTHTHTSHIFSTHRAHVAFPVNVLSGRQRRWPRRYGGGFGGGSEGIAVTRRQGRMVVTRTGHCHPPGYRRHNPLLHAKSPFVALDGKLLFVRRLRGEFSDDETRSFRTRYDSDSRRLRERMSYEYRGEPRSIICYELFGSIIIEQIIIN